MKAKADFRSEAPWHTSVGAVGAPSDRLRACLLLTSSPRNTDREDVRYVYCVIEPHGLRYKHRRRAARGEGAPGRPGSPLTITLPSATKKRNVYLCVHGGQIPRGRSPRHEAASDSRSGTLPPCCGHPR